MDEERHAEDEATDAETEPRQDVRQPGFLDGRLMGPVGGRALALAGFAVLAITTISSRTSVTTP
jgi:hypothetical protein